MKIEITFELPSGSKTTQPLTATWIDTSLAGMNQQAAEAIVVNLANGWGWEQGLEFDKCTFLLAPYAECPEFAVRAIVVMRTKRFSCEVDGLLQNLKQATRALDEAVQLVPFKEAAPFQDMIAKLAALLTRYGR